MQGVILLLFAKYYHLPFLRDVQTDCTRTGLGGYWVSEGVVGADTVLRGRFISPRIPGIGEISLRSTHYSEARLSPTPPTTLLYILDPVPFMSLPGGGGVPSALRLSLDATLL